MSRDHYDKYEAMCAMHGVKWNKDSPRFVGATLEELKRCYDEDHNLNNIRLRLWDYMAYEFLSYHKGKGISLCEAVCMQKHAAVRLLEETYGFSAVEPDTA